MNCQNTDSMLHVPPDSNILDHCYTTIKDAYHSVPRAYLGLSDHCLVHLIPTYRQKLKSEKPVLRTVKRWTNEAEQDYYQHWSSSGLSSLPHCSSLSIRTTATSKDPSVKLLKFADDTTLIGLIQDGDESAYRQEVKELAVWCSLNNLELNTLKTVEMIVDFRRNPPALPPLTIMNSTVTAVESFRFLGTTISQDLKWDNHIVSIVKKAQQRLYFLHQLRSSTCHRSCWYSSTLPSLNPSSARQ